MNNLKCPNCGADISSNEAQTSGKCQYCNTRFAAEKKPEPKIDQTHAEIYNSIRPDKPRPRIRFSIVLLLFFFCGPLFFAYIVYIEIKKKAWDLKHINNPSVDAPDIFDM